MKTSDSDLKVNRNIYPDAVTCDMVRLIGPKCDQSGRNMSPRASGRNVMPQESSHLVYVKATSLKLIRLWYSDEYRAKKAFKYVKRMLPLFRAVVKFCSTNRLIILECIVYQFHRLLAMKLINLRAQQIERVGCVGCVPARSRAIARVSLKGLYF